MKQASNDHKKLSDRDLVALFDLIIENSENSFRLYFFCNNNNSSSSRYSSSSR